MIGARPSSGSSSSMMRGLSDERAADRQHLLLAAGELVAEIAAPLGEPRKHAVDALQRPRPGRATAVRFSSTVSERKMLRSCGTQPMPACGALVAARSAVMSRPSRRMLPPMWRVTPTIVLTSVVLPVPLRPSSASDWPSAIAKLDVGQHDGLAVAGAEALDVAAAQASGSSSPR